MHTELWQDILQEDETLIWNGDPQQGFIFRRSEILFTPLAILLFVLAAAWEFYAVSTLATALQFNDLPLWIPVVLIFMTCTAFPFVLLGLFLLVGRFFYDRQRRMRTHYALTNRRVIILSGLFKKQRACSVELQNIEKLSLHVHRNHTGSIRFRSDTLLWWLLVGPHWWLPLWTDVEVYQPPVLERIKQAGEVFKQIQEVGLSNSKSETE